MISFLKLLRFLIIGIVLTGVMIWLIDIFFLRCQLNREIQRCQEEHDLAASVHILKQALDHYPEAPNRSTAKQLLKTYEQQLTQTRELSLIMTQAKDNPDLSTAIVLLKEGLDKNAEATNQAVAQQILTTLQQRQSETERLAVAIQYAKQSQDPAYGIEVLTQTLSESPRALNRKEAEDLLAMKKQQLARECSAQLPAEPVPGPSQR